MIKKHHPQNKAERRYLDRKYSLKRTRPVGLEDKEYVGAIVEEIREATGKDRREGD